MGAGVAEEPAALSAPSLSLSLLHPVRASAASSPVATTVAVRTILSMLNSPWMTNDRPSYQ